MLEQFIKSAWKKFRENKNEKVPFSKNNNNNSKQTNTTISDKAFMPKHTLFYLKTWMKKWK